MKYKARYYAKFETQSFCYMCYPKKNKNGVLYELNMTGYQKVVDAYSLERSGYNNYLLNYTLSGTGAMKYCGREYTLKAGDLTFINCAEPHSFESVGGGWEFVFLHVSGPGVTYLYDAFEDATGNVYENYDGKAFLDRMSKLHALLAAQNKTRAGADVYSINTDDDSTLCDIAELVYGMLTDTVRKLAALPGDCPHRLKTALDYIHEHFTENVTLDAAAKVAYLSKYHFERMFRRYTGKTFYGYVTQLRFERARWLLDTTTKSLSDIAAEIGYSDIQPLNKLFKKNFGVTPTAYRKERDNYKTSD